MNFKKRMLSAIDIPSLFILLFIIGWVAFLVLDSVLPPKRNIPSQLPKGRYIKVVHII